MISKKITLINKLGLHARAAMKLVNIASRYQSEVILKYGNREVNAKSIMNIMALGASCGAEIELIITGADETEAMAAIVKLINNRFGEAE